MDRSGKRDTCTGKVVGVTHDHGKVAMKTTTTRGRDGTRVSEQLTLQ